MDISNRNYCNSQFNNTSSLKLSANSEKILCTECSKLDNSKCMDRITHLLQLNLLPDVPNATMHLYGKEYSPLKLEEHYKRCNEQKKKILAQHIDAQTAEMISTQAFQCPRMLTALSVLNSTLAMWEDISLSADQKAFDFLKEQISEQVKGLATLKKEKMSALNLNPKHLVKMRSNAPITTSAIQQHAHLHQAIREAKSWASQQPTLHRYPGSNVNDVFCLSSMANHEPVAFFKVGRNEEKAAGCMEKLVWNIAVLLDLDEQFVPTAETEIGDRSLLAEGTQKAMQWNEDGDLEKFETAKSPRRGGIQIAQKGTLLHDKPLVPRSEIIKGVFTSLVFGMFDAHLSNMMLTAEGKLKFFDNTKSLPNANGFIDTGKGVHFAYRCGLLDFEEARKPLSSQEMGELKISVAKCKQKMGDLKKYLASKDGQTLLNKLPPGWMEVDSSFAAMEERIDQMEKALYNDIKTLEALVMQSIPSYRFACALTYLKFLSKSKKEKTSSNYLHLNVGYHDVNETMKDMLSKGIDLGAVKLWCDNQNLSKAKLLENINIHYKDILSRSKDWYRHDLNDKNTQVAKQTCCGLTTDFKDIPRELATHYVEAKNLATFEKMGIKYLPRKTLQSIRNGMRFAMQNDLDAVLIGNPSNWKIIQETPRGFLVKNIDLSILGKVCTKTFTSSGKCVVGKGIKIQNFCHSLWDPAPTKFEELPILSLQMFKEITLKNGLSVSKNTDGLKLLIGLRVNKGKDIASLNFEPDQNGTFSIKGQARAIDQIAEIYQRLVDSMIP